MSDLLRRSVLDRQLGANDGAQPGLGCRLVEARRAVDAIRVEQRQRRIAERGRAVHERLGKGGALKKAEGRCGVELDVHSRQQAVNSSSINDTFEEPMA